MRQLLSVCGLTVVCLACAVPDAAGTAERLTEGALPEATAPESWCGSQRYMSRTQLVSALAQESYLILGSSARVVGRVTLTGENPDGVVQTDLDVLSISGEVELGDAAFSAHQVLLPQQWTEHGVGEDGSERRFSVASTGQEAPERVSLRAGISRDFALLVGADQVLSDRLC